MFEWKMTPATGEIIETSRTLDGRSEKTINKNVDPPTLNGGELDSDSESPSVEWDEIEAQRDLAFKIMYMFIALIIVTFLTISAYFVVIAREEKQARARTTQKREEIEFDCTDS